MQPVFPLHEAGAEARRAARGLATANRDRKDAALREISELLLASREQLLLANRVDVERARNAGLADALVDRLVLDDARIRAMATSVLEIAALEDPVGEVVGMKRRPNGLLVGQVRIPIGVIAIIYESRPNVTVDAAALCLKSGNAVLLRGGKEALQTNSYLAELVRVAAQRAGIPEGAVWFIPPSGEGDREGMKRLVQMSGVVDLVIPRGGEGLIRFVTEHARVPVIQHFKGVCHLYVDEGADVEQAFRLIENGKLQRPGVCNALECLLVHRAVAEPLLAKLSALVPRLEVRGDAETVRFCPGARAASPDDYGQEFLAPILAAKVVSSFDEAIEHIAKYGSNHTEAICTRDHARAQQFLRAVDASMVLVNASTRFNDGGELGLGAEIGISTTKLHAYGPMGLASLTALKWIGIGDGQTR